MKNLVVLIAFLVSVINYSQDYTLLHINSAWNTKNNYKDLNKIKGVKIVKALLEDQQPSIKKQIKSVPVIFLYKNNNLIGRWDGGISLQIKATYLEIQEVIDDSKIAMRRVSTE